MDEEENPTPSFYYCEYPLKDVVSGQARLLDEKKRRHCPFNDMSSCFYRLADCMTLKEISI
jgi:hypothetical protein